MNAIVWTCEALFSTSHLRWFALIAAVLCVCALFFGWVLARAAALGDRPLPPSPPPTVRVVRNQRPYDWAEPDDVA